MEHIPGETIFIKRSELGVGMNGLLALLTIGVAIIVGAAFFRVVDGRFVGSTLVSQGIVAVGGQLLVAQHILRRAGFKARWGERAYAIAFRWFVIPGLSLIGVSLAHFGWIEGEHVVSHEVALVPFLYLLITGLILWVRAILAFGLDNLTMMYVYFPNEGRLVQSNVYSVLRHPVYSAVMRVALALALWNGGVLALCAGLIALLVMTGWLRWVEEPELIERFGEGYREYRARVPAFFNLNPQTWPVLWRFLLTGQ